MQDLREEDSLGLDELDQLESDLNDFTDSKGDDLFKDTIQINDNDDKPSVSFEEPKLTTTIVILQLLLGMDLKSLMIFQSILKQKHQVNQHKVKKMHFVKSFNFYESLKCLNKKVFSCQKSIQWSLLY